MKSLNNFERAKKLTEEWPAWKRDYQLTKNSGVREEREWCFLGLLSIKLRPARRT